MEKRIMAEHTSDKTPVGWEECIPLNGPQNNLHKANDNTKDVNRDESFIEDSANVFIHNGKLSDESEEASEDTSRLTWGRKAEYILSMVGYCVGLGNVWRFPYVCIRNGGGAFLIPFFICLFACGLPLYFMEVAMGQFLSKSSWHVFAICPLFAGLGIAMNVLSLIVSWFFLVVLAWSLIYLVNSFKDPLPWTLCGQWWNSEHCRPTSGSSGGIGANGSGSVAEALNETSDQMNLWMKSYNLTASNDTVKTNLSKSASEEFWTNNVLEMSAGFEYMGGLPWHTSVAMVVSAILILLGAIKGVQSLGKVVYVTATLPYILITVLLIKGATLPGAIDGVIFYVKPDFDKLLDPKTWIEASLQVFYSLGPCWGGLTTMASYNKFSNNCLRDAVLLTVLCEGTSVFAGFAIFTILGHMSGTLNVPISAFTQAGPGLAFVVYPEALSYLPIPQLWSVLFFAMLITLGLDTHFMCVETVMTTVSDLWPKMASRFKVPLTCAFMAFILVLSLVFASRGGMYYFQLVDWYVAALSTVVIGILECLAVGWIYGANRFCDDIALMIGSKPPFIFEILWIFVTPTLLSAVFIFTLLSYEPPTLKGYVYSKGLEGLGWCIALISFIPIPLYAAYLLFQAEGSFLERLKSTCTPSKDWKPSDPDLRDQYIMDTKHLPICNLRMPCSRV